MADKAPETPGEEAAAPEETPAKEEVKDPKDMSEEELDSFLSGEEPEEPGSTAEGEEKKKEEEKEKEGGEDAPPKKETPAEEPEKNKDGEADPAAKGDTEASPEIKALMEEIEALKKKTANQDKFFDRMGTEVGLLRKKTPEEDRVELEKIRDAYIEDPVEGHRLMEEFRANQDKTTGLQNEYAANRQAEANREALAAKLPDMDKAETVNELAAIMTEDGAPAGAVEVFKSNPFYMDQATLFNLHQRYSLKKENTGLKEQLEAKEKEITELKGKPAKLLEGIEKAAGNTTLKGGGGGKKAEATKGEQNTAKMTSEELDKLLK